MKQPTLYLDYWEAGDERKRQVISLLFLSFFYPPGRKQKAAQKRTARRTANKQAREKQAGQKSKTKEQRAKKRRESRKHNSRSAADSKDRQQKQKQEGQQTRDKAHSRTMSTRLSNDCFPMKIICGNPRR